MQMSLIALKMSFIACFSFLLSQEPIKVHELLLVVSLALWGRQRCDLMCVSAIQCVRNTINI